MLAGLGLPLRGSVPAWVSMQSSLNVPPASTFPMHSHSTNLLPTSLPSLRMLCLFHHLGPSCARENFQELPPILSPTLPHLQVPKAQHSNGSCIAFCFLIILTAATTAITLPPLDDDLPAGLLTSLQPLGPSIILLPTLSRRESKITHK